jgi:glutamyl-tRNA synthetase
VSLRQLREQGYLATAIANHLFRLGHSTAVAGLLSFDDMARAFHVQHLQRSPAHFDPAQLLGWQREAVHRQDLQQARAWLGHRIPPGLDPAAVDAFIAAVLPNVVLPDEALPWLDVAFGAAPSPDAESAAAIESASVELFRAAAGAARGNDFSAIVAAAKAATGLKGPALFKPLRAALTGRLAGPDLGMLLKAMPPGMAEQRLARFGAPALQ